MKPIRSIFSSLSLTVLLVACGGGGNSIAECAAELYPKPETSEYILPYNIGSEFIISQGNCTQRGHSISAFGDLRYTYDFAMPVGTEVLAARGGEVISIVNSFANGNLIGNEANFITIQHSDSTIAQYVHLANKSEFVAVGQFVFQGTPIGLSGDSGVTSAPKLHFELIENPLDSCIVNSNITNCQSIPLTFSNIENQDIPLIEGQSYIAEQF